MRIKKTMIAVMVAIVMTAVCSVTAFAATTASSYWYQDGANWKINKPGTGTVKNSWVCDNANNASDVDSNWYLMDSEGKMYEGVINDNGHYYLLNPNHDGNYGMMISGVGEYTWNGVKVELETQHNGYFGEIKNTGIVGSLGLAVTNVNTSGVSSEYTANWGSSGSSGGSSGVTVEQGSGMSKYSSSPLETVWGDASSLGFVGQGDANAADPNHDFSNVYFD